MKWSRPPSGLRQVPARLTGVWLCLSAAHYCLESQCCCPPAAQDQAKDRTGPVTSVRRPGQGHPLLSVLKGPELEPAVLPVPGCLGLQPRLSTPRDAAGAGPPLAGHSPWGLCHILGRKEREGCWWWRWGGVLLTSCLPGFHSQYSPHLVPVSLSVSSPAPRSGGGLHLPWASQGPSPTPILKFPCSGACDLIKDYD